jgi:hypothetical protein
MQWLAEDSGIDDQVRMEIAQLLFDAEAHKEEALFRAVENDDEDFALFLRERWAED